MRPGRWLLIALLVSTCGYGTVTARAEDKKEKEREAVARHAAEKAEHERKEREAAARHTAEKAEHERKHREAVAKEKAEHERKKHEAALKEKAEHERKQHEAAQKVAKAKQAQETSKNGEHSKKTKQASEARIAAAKKHREAHPIDKKKQTPRDRQIAGNLSKIAVTLHQADHDYDWQRHEAVELVRGALHDLHEPEPNTSGKFGGMTQKKSDEMLRENIPKLESLRSELAAKGAPGNHQAARVKIEEALSNLHAALRIE
jgi:hypothetical protein